MLDKLNLPGGVPFCLPPEDKNNNGKKLSINWTRLIEAIIIAGVGGFLAGYVAVKKIETHLTLLDKQVIRLEERVNQFNQQFNYPKRK